MKGRETKATPSADLLVCFPSRAHLTLMPKPICSPGRPPEPNKRHHNNHHLKKSSTNRGGGQGSPLLWAKTKPMGSEIAEPTSPKVTCAGQIKVRPKTPACRNWQSVMMEEIEKIHNHNNKEKQKIKRPSWARSLSFKKEAMQFLACMRGARFDLCCFGTFHGSNITPEEEEDEYEDEGCRENQAVKAESDSETSRTVFSKWFMVLQGNQSNKVHKEDTKDKDMVATSDGSTAEAEEHTVPPPNALLLMRCRSAPVKSCFKENEEENNEEQEREENEQSEEGKVKEKAKANKGKNLKSLLEENRKKENLLVMQYDSDFYKISSSGIAKEAWIFGGLRDPLSRSESWN